jgi:hypothetical protein
MGDNCKLITQLVNLSKLKKKDCYNSRYSVLTPKIP